MTNFIYQKNLCPLSEAARTTHMLLAFGCLSLLTALGRTLRHKEMQVLHKPNWSTNTAKSVSLVNGKQPTTPAQYLAGVYSSPTANSPLIVN